jgi:hypothetical protein
VFARSLAFEGERGVSKTLTGLRGQAESPPVEIEPVEAEPYRPFTPFWGRHATLWEWLVTFGAIAVFGVIFRRLTDQRLAELGHDAFPQWLWDLFDLKVWPLSWLKGGAYAPSWWPW